MNILNALTRSSSDPQKLSLTIKGILMAVAPLIIGFTNLSSGEYGAIVDGVTQVIFWVLSIISTGQIVWGLSRKVSFGRWSAKPSDVFVND